MLYHLTVEEKLKVEMLFEVLKVTKLPVKVRTSWDKVYTVLELVKIGKDNEPFVVCPGENNYFVHLHLYDIEEILGE